MAVAGWGGRGVCLLLGLGHAKAGGGVNNHPYLGCWRWSMGAWGEPALASPSAALATNRGQRQARAAAPESLAVDLVLRTECGVGPPWLDSRGPPGSAPGPWVDRGVASQTGSPEKGCASSPRSRTRHHAQDRGFATAFG